MRTELNDSLRRLASFFILLIFGACSTFDADSELNKLTVSYNARIAGSRDIIPAPQESAQLASETLGALTAKGYRILGVVGLENVLYHCEGVGCASKIDIGFCRAKRSQAPDVQTLSRAAAEKHGDTFILTQDREVDIFSGYTRGKCTLSDSTYDYGQKKIVTKSCLVYERIESADCVERSKAIVLAHGPEVDKVDGMVRNLEQMARELKLIVPKIGDYGYINAMGAFVVPPRYNRAGTFYDGAARVDVVTGHSERACAGRIIDNRGRVVSPEGCITGERFYDGFIKGKNANGIEGFFDKSGKWHEKGGSGVYRMNSTDFEDTQGGGLIRKELDGKYGFVNSAGKWVIYPLFKSADFFREGLAAVAVSVPREGETPIELWGYIREDGTWAIKPQFWNAEGFREGLAAVRPLR